jgi:CRP-like cAMP-binding protein
MRKAQLYGGDTVYKRGDAAEDMYIVLQGRVRPISILKSANCSEFQQAYRIEIHWAHICL